MTNKYTNRNRASQDKYHSHQDFEGAGRHEVIAEQCETCVVEKDHVGCKVALIRVLSDCLEDDGLIPVEILRRNPTFVLVDDHKPQTRHPMEEQDEHEKQLEEHGPKLKMPRRLEIGHNAPQAQQAEQFEHAENFQARCVCGVEKQDSKQLQGERSYQIDPEATLEVIFGNPIRILD